MHTISLNKKNLKRFTKVFDNILYLDILDINTITIDSIKSKLKLASIEIKESNSSTQTLTFTTEQLRVLKHLSIQYISMKKAYQKTNQNDSDFTSYLKKFKGVNYDK
ncbi:hypothetical protein [Halarcobacter sp.]|uniref:hypothetical protein n=1 Tax=Halarcobacter sp. TaxID=2321133 RepID=UPI003A8D614F